MANHVADRISNGIDFNWPEPPASRIGALPDGNGTYAGSTRNPRPLRNRNHDGSRPVCWRGRISCESRGTARASQIRTTYRLEYRAYAGRVGVGLRKFRRHALASGEPHCRGPKCWSDQLADCEVSAYRSSYRSGGDIPL